MQFVKRVDPQWERRGSGRICDRARTQRCERETVFIRSILYAIQCPGAPRALGE